MKRSIFFQFFFWTVFLSMFSQTNSQLFIESQSKFGFSEMVEKMVQSVTEVVVHENGEKKVPTGTEAGVKIVATHDLQQTLQKNGVDVLPVTVLSICHPKHSGKLLKTDTERFISPMMPCRVSVYEKSNGVTYISRLNALSLTPLLEGSSGEVMKESFLDVENMIKGLIIP